MRFFSPSSIPPRGKITLLLIALLLGGSLLIEMRRETTRLAVLHRTLRLSKLPPDFRSLKIAVAADFHIKDKDLRSGRLAAVVDRINAEKPDLILLLGDFVNRTGANPPLAGSGNELRRLHAPLGVFAVLGNHDYRYRLPDLRRMLESAGITVLENRSVLLDTGSGPLRLAGVTDRSSGWINYRAALPPTDDVATLLLSHSPKVLLDQPVRRADFVLAAHTHGGQIRLPLLRRLYPKGMYIGGGMPSFVTSGLGTSHVDLRLNCTPEIVILTLKNRTGENSSSPL